MGKITPMAESFNMAHLRRELQRLMDRDGVKAKPLAKFAGLGETAIRDIFLEDRTDVRVGTLFKIADFFGVTVDSLTGSGVPLKGKIGAGGAVIFFEDDDPAYVPRPPLAGGSHLIALEVSGDSMLPRYDPGDIIYVNRSHDGVLPNYIGKYCAVGLVEGGVYLKILSLGSVPNRYTLRSLNAADITDVEVLWAAPVLFAMPKDAIKI